MKTGLNRYKPGRETIIASRFKCLITIRNGVITEDIGSSSEIYEMYRIRLDDWINTRYNWIIAANDDGYLVLLCNPSNEHYYISDNIHLRLTVGDREGLVKNRDSCLLLM